MRKETKQHTLWLIAAVSAPLAHFSSCGWFPALLASAVILPLNLVPKCWEGMSRTLTMIQIIWFGIVAGILLKNSAVYWPSDQELTVPLTLLALAAVTGKKAGPRIGAVLAFCIGLLAIPVVIAGAKHLEPRWLGWIAGSWPGAQCLILLFPSLPSASGERKAGRSGVVGMLALLMTLLVQGTISPEAAGAVPDPFYQTARTLGHLEPIAAVGMTLGWYAMAIYLLRSASMIGEGGEIRSWTANVLPLGTAAAVILTKWQPDYRICLILSAFLWIFAPFLSKIKKVEKR